MKISKVLHKAKPFMLYNEFVCHAILDLERARIVPDKDADKTIKYIEARIAPYHTVAEWLKNSGVPWRQLTNKNLEEYRKRWIDHMINELEKEGK